MKKLIQKILSITTAIMMALGLIMPAFTPAPAYAADGETPKAVILTGCADVEKSQGNGAGVKCVVRLVIQILSVLVGIVGVIGIVVVGIQYLTAGGNEEQTRKAKRRLFEIVIGIIAYVLVAAFLSWLLPGYSPNNDSTNTNTSSILDTTQAVAISSTSAIVSSPSLTTGV